MPKKSKTFIRTAEAAAQVKQALAHGFTRTELGNALGVSGGAVGRWITANAAPPAAGLACECLLRRNGSNYKPATTRLFLVRPKDESLIPALESLSLSMVEIDLK